MAAEDITLVSTAGTKPSAPTRIEVLTIEGPASYDQAGGGYDIAANLALALPGRVIADVRLDTNIANGDADGEAVFVHATSKIKYLVAAGTEVANLTDLTGQTHTAVVISE
jgi:hypothetical protein